MIARLIAWPLRFFANCIFCVAWLIDGEEGEDLGHYVIKHRP